ncbi:MAG: hypothetical protein V9H26_21225 [Verrucomicrobiota bacterium]
MRTSRFIPILFAAFLSSLVHSSAADGIDGFTKLTSGDTLQVRFTSEGCFHFYTDVLTFTSTNGSVAVVMGNLGKELTVKELAGLDILLAFYRTNTFDRCTTRNEITISQIRGGKVIATEQFKDASCRARKVKDVLTIEALSLSLPPKKDKK